MAAMDERLPDGRTVAEALAALLAQQGGARGVGPTPTIAGTAAPALNALPPPATPAPAVTLGALPETAVDPAIPVARPPIYSGERTEGMSPLGKLLAQRRQLSDPRNLNRKVFETAEGIEVAPEGGPPSRKKQALIGLLQGAAAGAQGPTEGAALRALGGAATGAATGAINPRIMKALTRQQEIDRLDTDIDRQMGLDLGQARIAETEAQTRQRDAIARQAAELTDYTDPDTGEVYQMKPEQAARMAQRDRLRRTEELLVDYKPPSGPVRRIKESEAARLEQRDRLDNPPTATEEIEVGGRKFKVPPATAARILEERSKAGDKPDAALESTIEAQLEEESATRYRTGQTDAEARLTELRAKRDSLSKAATAVREGTPGYERVNNFIKEVDGQIKSMEDNVQYFRKQADDARDRAVKVRGKAAATPGRNIDGAIKAFRTRTGRAPTPEETARMQAALDR